jgi:hypothetical protein
MFFGSSPHWVLAARRSGGGSWVVGPFRVESTIVRAIAVNVAGGGHHAPKSDETRCNPSIDRSERFAGAMCCRSRRAFDLHRVGAAGAHRGASTRTERLTGR